MKCVISFVSIVTIACLAACTQGSQAPASQAAPAQPAAAATEPADAAAQPAAAPAQPVTAAAAPSANVPPFQVINETNPGEPIDIAKFAVAGKTVIFDFYSEYCPPCRAISPRLAALVAARGDLVVRKIDINRKGTRGIDWESPVAEQYKLDSIPHFKIMDANGKVTSEGDAASELIFQWLSEKNL